ncbi:hypothetical protein JST56_07025 [Candidatus Dependentiae bacterium]|nr:hypothetical protein [Candidatus Dependentiae bacterium]
MEPASDDVVFSDQDDNVRRLYGNPYRVFKLNIGGNYGVPEWMLDKINRAFCTDTFLINEKRYVKNDGAKFDVTRYNTFPLLFSEIELREYYNDAAGAFFNTAPVTLFTRPGTYPYVNTEWRMRDKNGNEIFGGVFEYIDASYDTGYLTYFNNVVVPQHDLQGLFSWVDDNFTYTNGEDESFIVVTKASVSTTYLEATVNITDTTAPFQYTQGGTGFHILVPDSDHLPPGIVTEPGNNSLGNPLTVTQLYIYNTTGNKVWRLYTFGNSMTVLQFPQQSNKVTAIDPATKVSSKLRKFGCFFQNFGAVSLDLSFLAPAKDELRELAINSSNITGITAGWASALVSGSYKPFKLLRYVYLNYNSLNNAAEDAFFNEFYGSTNYAYNGGWGQINMVGQSPAAAPTAASTTARNALTALFYSLTW